ncbi:MAG: hypothetical protein RLP44_06355 [Aggregatilineales bacterium]
MITNVFELLDIRTGNIALNDVRVEKWGSVVVVDAVYRYPPEEKAFTLRFTGVRSIQWITVKLNSDADTAQVLTHDIGEGNYQRTARFATVLAEVVISYGEVAVEKDW